MAAVRHFEFLNYANFHLLHALQLQSACSCKISSRSLQRWRRYSDLFIFNMAAVRHFEFWKYAIDFQFLHGLQWQSACSCKISSRSVERLRIYCKLLIFNTTAARNLEFVKYANLNMTHGLQF